MLFAALMLSACPEAGVGTPAYEDLTDGSETQDDEAGAPPPDSPPELVSESVSYDEAGGLMQEVSLTFNVNVRVAGLSGDWELAGGDGGSVITFTPPADFTAGINELAFTAVNMVDENKTLPVSAKIMLTNGLFERLETARTYVTEYYKHGAAGLRRVDGGEPETDYLYINEADANLRRILEAVYQPETPQPLSVLDLFKITVDGTDNDRIEIRGTELTGVGGINIGLPAGGAENDKLPAFRIPYRGLGEEGGSYPNITLRVNAGAYLVIEADEEEGDGYGHLTNAVVDVAGGGKLRSEAGEGFPLGQGSVVISRLNSYLAAGKDTGWMIAPFGGNPVVAWGTGDQNGGYIEIREGRIAFDANLFIVKPLHLTYSLWFVNSPSLTIRDGAVVTGTGKFYGTSSSSGGENVANPAAKIIIESGSLAKDFLNDDAAPANPITAAGSGRILNKGRPSSTSNPIPFKPGDARKGYLNWKLQ
jgi:hypothetical protein